jgi:hypothetical protein
MAVAFTALEMGRCPLVIDAPTLTSQLAKAMPRGNETSTSVSRVVEPMTPVFVFHVATSPNVEGKLVTDLIQPQ